MSEKSRSQLRREAAQRSEATPTFDAPLLSPEQVESILSWARGSETRSYYPQVLELAAAYARLYEAMRALPAKGWAQLLDGVEMVADDFVADWVRALAALRAEMEEHRE
jgi:hypothetical protein